MKQKSIEQFLGVHREDKYNGGQLIDVYREYLHTHEKFLFDLLIDRMAILYRLKWQKRAEKWMK